MFKEVRAKSILLFFLLVQYNFFITWRGLALLLEKVGKKIEMDFGLQVKGKNLTNFNIIYNYP